MHNPGTQQQFHGSFFVCCSPIPNFPRHLLMYLIATVLRWRMITFKSTTKGNVIIMPLLVFQGWKKRVLKPFMWNRGLQARAAKLYPIYCIGFLHHKVYQYPPQFLFFKKLNFIWKQFVLSTIMLFLPMQDLNGICAIQCKDIFDKQQVTEDTILNCARIARLAALHCVQCSRGELWCLPRARAH